jgi:hypothetical protein
MSSLKQIAANRCNALKSTGPITPEGKERLRCNAVRHGLTAETVIAALEDVEDYQAFEAAVIADYDAETAVERELVLRLASVLWRLRRATGVETSLFESAAGPALEPKYSGLTLVAGSDASKDNHITAAKPSAAAAGSEPGLRFLRGTQVKTHQEFRMASRKRLRVAEENRLLAVRSCV